MSYYRELAHLALTGDDANMSRYAQALIRLLDKRARLVSASRISEIDEQIKYESRQIERWRSTSPRPERLAKLVDIRLNRSN